MAATAAASDPAPPPPPPTSPPPSALSRWLPTLPAINFNLDQLNPFTAVDPAKAGTDQTKPATDPSKPADDRPATASLTKRLTFSAFSLTSAPHASTTTAAAARPPSPSRSIASIMFAEPETRRMSEIDSRNGSLDDISPSPRLRNSTTAKPKTRYSICHPPPGTSSTRQRMHRRPRPLLQLHRLTSAARPQPAFDVVPAANFSVRLTRAITKVFKAKHGLCPHDLVVLRAEKYDEEDEEQAVRDVLGLICKGRKDDPAVAAGKARICMASGQEWEASPLANGGYEFSSTDAHGLGETVRWVVKKGKEAGTAGREKEKRFNFSTVSPNTRRHPVIANLSRTGLEVNETYKMPDPAAVTPISTPSKSASNALAEAMQAEGADDIAPAVVCETAEPLRHLITLTSIWVTFKEGWSPNYRPEEKDRLASGLARVASLSTSPTHSKSQHSLLHMTSPPASPPASPLEKRESLRSLGSASVSGLLQRKSSMRGARTEERSRRFSVVQAREVETNGEEVHEDDDEADEGADESRPLSRSGMVATTPTKSGRTRGDSTATVLVHRTTSTRHQTSPRRAQNPPSTTQRPDLLASSTSVDNQPAETLPRAPASTSPALAQAPALTSVKSPSRPTLVSAMPDPGARPASHGTRGSEAETVYSGFSEGVQKRGSIGRKGRGEGKEKRGWRRLLLCGGGVSDV